MEESVNTAFTFLASHGYLVVFVWMFADQAALPLPSIPLLVAAGAVAAGGGLDLTTVIAVASVATVLADSLWFLIGKHGGGKAIGLVCRLSIEPDSCVAATRNAFGRFGPVTLIIAKYLPGVQTLAPASAGIAGAPWLGFLALDLIGTLLFVVPFVFGGYFFAAQITSFVTSMGEVTGGIALLVVTLILIYVLFKASQWIWFLRGHRLRRLTTEDLSERLDGGQPTTIVDLRQRLDYEQTPHIIPGALRIPINEVPRRRPEIPREHDVVLVCT